MLTGLETLTHFGVAANQSDGELLDRYLSRDGRSAEAAFEALVARHGPMVFEVCYNVLRDPHDAEDAFQATFLVLASGGGSIRRREALAGWLLGVARRVALRLRADVATRRVYERRAAERRAWSRGEPHEAWPELHEEIGRLPERYREPVVLCYLEGLSTEAAAKRLGCPHGTVLSRLSRARDRLRGGLARRRDRALPAALPGAGLLPEVARTAISPDLLNATVRIALESAEKPGAVALSSTTAAVLARGVIHTMMLTKLKFVGAAILTCALAAGTLPSFALPGGGQDRADPAAKLARKVQRRAVQRLVKDFPEKKDLSTPESAQAAWNRASAHGDDEALLELSWVKWGPNDIENMKSYRRSHPGETVIKAEAERNAEIVEVATYREDCAVVISKLALPQGVGQNPYSVRSFGRIDGAWKNLGEDRKSTLEAAREPFDRDPEALWRWYVLHRESVKTGRPVTLPDEPRDTSARIAPGEPMGISVEKADLMGRVEWVMMHGGRDITSRKSIEWGEVEGDGKGNRSIRYRFDAIIWDRDVYAMHKVFTFDATGNLLSMRDVPGFPRKVEKTVDVGTEAGLKALVEGFFTKNYHDITSRETIEWGESTRSDQGQASIRYMYRAWIRGANPRLANQIFTFDSKGEFVSVKDVEGFPQVEHDR
jgi:RNA polymerase sigma factor (sigma-70 family)